MGDAEIPPDIGAVEPFPGFRDKGFRGEEDEVLLFALVRKGGFDPPLVELAEEIVKNDVKKGGEAGLQTGEITVMKNEEEDDLEDQGFGDHPDHSQGLVEAFAAQDAVVAVGEEDHQELADGVERALDQEGFRAVGMPAAVEDPIGKEEASLQAEQVDQDEIPVLQEASELPFVHRGPDFVCPAGDNSRIPPGMFVLVLCFSAIAKLPVFFCFLVIYNYIRKEEKRQELRFTQRQFKVRS